MTGMSRVQIERPQYHSSNIDIINGPKRFAEAVRFIRDELGIKPFTRDELYCISGRFIGEIEAGLRHDGTSSLAMIDTKLPLLAETKLPRNTDVLVVEIGGSKIRAAVTRKGNSGKVEIKPDEGEVKKFVEKELKQKVFKSADEFYDAVFEIIDPVVRTAKPKALSIVWSFPGEAFEREKGKGVDVISDAKLTKELIIPGINQVPVGKAILTRLKEKYGYEDIPLAVMNDTRAAEGGIIATGFNFLFGRYNSESGGFDKLGDLPWIYQEIDRRSTNPGKQLAEKQISGKYLGELIKIACEKLAEKGLISKQVIYYDAEVISRLLNITIDSELKKESLNAYNLSILMYLVNQASIRSAQLAGIMAGTGIVAFPDIYRKKKIRYPIEGSVYKYIPGYQENVQYYGNFIANLYGKDIVCPQIDHAGIIGAGKVGLGLLI